MMAALPGLLALIALSSPDYRAENTQWHGTSYLETTAREAKVDLRVARSFDWGDARPGDVIVIVGGSNVNAATLGSFIEDGGLAVVAVDGATDEALLDVLGVTLDSRPVVHDQYYRDHPAFPVLRPPDGPSEPHFLWYNVEGVVLNHPAAFRFDKAAPGISALIPFAEPGQFFALELKRGTGYALLLSDASVFINDMQRHAYGDKQFAANAMRYYCEKDDCAVTLLTPGVDIEGAYEPINRKGLKGVEYVLGRGIEALNRLAISAGEFVGRKDMLWLWGLLLTVALIGSTLLLPWPKRIPRFAWEADAIYRPGQVDYWVTALSTARSNADFSLAAVALRARLERELRSRLSVGWPEDDKGLNGWVDAIGDNGHQGPSRLTRTALALRVAKTLNMVTAARSSGVGATRHLSVSEFEDLWTDCETLLKALPTPKR
ncbi:MAG: hypothetical protein ACI9OJ_001786 [Myxococcota bacterium]|jgi:hypothetical protein